MYSFLTNLIYYNSIGTLFFLTGFLALEYASDPIPRNFIYTIKYYGSSICLWTLDKYITMKLFYQDYIQHAIKKCLGQDKNMIQIMTYDKSNNYSLFIDNPNMTDDDTDEEDTNNEDTNDNIYTLYVYTINEEKYIFTYNPCIEDIEEIENIEERMTHYKTKPFIQCDITYNEKTIDFSGECKEMCMTDNVLNKESIYIVLRDFLNMDVGYYSDFTYTTHIMDTNFENKTYNEKDTIKITAGGYTKI